MVKNETEFAEQVLPKNSSSWHKYPDVASVYIIALYHFW